MVLPLPANTATTPCGVNFFMTDGSVKFHQDSITLPTVVGSLSDPWAPCANSSAPTLILSCFVSALCTRGQSRAVSSDGSNRRGTKGLATGTVECRFGCVEPR